MAKQLLVSIIVLLLVGIVIVLGVYYYLVNKPVGQTPDKNEVVDMNVLFAEIKAAPSAEAQQVVFARVKNLASDATTLDITGCQPQPPIIRVHLKQAFNLKNRDTVERQLVHGQFTLIAPPVSDKLVTPAFPGEGVFGYQCDDNLVGILYVTQ